MGHSILSLFPDTNSLLHYPPISQVNWRAVCGCESVRVVLCLPVIHELDEKKADPRLGERARSAIKELRSLKAAGGAVRDGVVLEIFNCELRREEFPETLSYDSSDDRIVHSVKKYATLNPANAVAVYSEDMGMGLRCEAHGLRIIEPDATCRLESPQSEQDKKYRAAITELNALKNAAPAIECVVCEGDATAPRKQKLEFVIHPKAGTRDLDAELEEYRKAGHVSVVKTTDLARSGQSSSLPPTHDAVANYNAAAEKHLVEYRQWLETRSLLEALHAHKVLVSIWLTNSGMAPADDIDIAIEVSEPVVLAYDADSKKAKAYELPEPPRPPVRPKQLFGDIASLGDFLGASGRGIEEMDLGFQQRPYVQKIEETRTYRITYSTKRLKHNEHERVGTFGFVVNPREIRTFDMHVRITAANVPHVIESRIPVIVDAATK